MKMIDRKKVEKAIKAWKAQSELGCLRKVMYKIEGTTLLIYCSRANLLKGKADIHYKTYVPDLLKTGIKEIKLIDVEDTIL